MIVIILEYDGAIPKECSMREGEFPAACPRITRRKPSTGVGVVVAEGQ